MRFVMSVSASLVFAASVVAGVPSAAALSPAVPMPLVQEFATPIASARSHVNSMPCQPEPVASPQCAAQTVVTVSSQRWRCWMFARAHVVSVVDSTVTVRLSGWFRPSHGRDRLCFSGSPASASVTVSGNVTKVVDFATGEAVSFTRWQTR